MYQIVYLRCFLCNPELIQARRDKLVPKYPNLKTSHQWRTRKLATGAIHPDILTLLTFGPFVNLVRVDPVLALEVPHPALGFPGVLLLPSLHPEVPVQMLRVGDHVGGRVPEAAVLALQCSRVEKNVDDCRPASGRTIGKSCDLSTKILVSLNLS